MCSIGLHVFVYCGLFFMCCFGLMLSCFVVRIFCYCMLCLCWFIVLRLSCCCCGLYCHCVVWCFSEFDLFVLLAFECSWVLFMCRVALRLFCVFVYFCYFIVCVTASFFVVVCVLLCIVLSFFVRWCFVFFGVCFVCLCMLCISVCFRLR